MAPSRATAQDPGNRKHTPLPGRPPGLRLQAQVPLKHPPKLPVTRRPLRRRKARCAREATGRTRWRRAGAVPSVRAQTEFEDGRNLTRGLHVGLAGKVETEWNLYSQARLWSNTRSSGLGPSEGDQMAEEEAQGPGSACLEGRADPHSTWSPGSLGRCMKEEASCLVARVLPTGPYPFWSTRWGGGWRGRPVPIKCKLLMSE